MFLLHTVPVRRVQLFFYQLTFIEQEITCDFAARSSLE